MTNACQPGGRLLKAAREKLKRAKMNTGWLCDAPGVGKNDAYLMTHQWMAEFGEHKVNANGKKRYRPTLLLCPTSSITQLVRTIATNYPRIHLMIGYNENNLKEQVPAHILDSKVMMGLPKLLKLPTQHKEYFDQTNKKAVHGLVVSTYQTGAKRMYQAKDVYVVENNEPKIITRDESNAKDLFRMVILDEAHMVRNPQTMLHRFVKTLNAPFHIIVSATPILNTPNDMVGLLRLVYSKQLQDEIRNMEWDQVNKSMREKILVSARQPTTNRQISLSSLKVIDSEEEGSDSGGEDHSRDRTYGDWMDHYPGAWIYQAAKGLERNDPRRYFMLNPDA
jgi:hypothetical protein